MRRGELAGSTRVKVLRSWGDAALAIMTRFNSSGVCERRGCAASDNGRGFVDQLVVLKSLYHEQGIVHAAREVALEDGIAYMLTPNR